MGLKQRIIFKLILEAWDGVRIFLKSRFGLETTIKRHFLDLKLNFGPQHFENMKI